MKKTQKEYTLGTEIAFSIRECTRGSRQSEYRYKGQRVLLDKPVVVPRKVDGKDGDKSIEDVEYTNCNIVRKASDKSESESEAEEEEEEEEGLLHRHNL